MPLSSSSTVLGTSLAPAAGSIDAVGVAAWAAIASVLCPWIVANVQIQPTGGAPLTAAGAVVTGTGSLLVVGASPALGSSLATAAGSVDAVGIAAWQSLAGAIATWLLTGTVVPAGLIAYVGAGAAPVTGAATLAFASAPLLAASVSSVDAVGVAKWAAIATALSAHVTSNAVASPLPLMVNPGVGGPVTGLGSLL